MKNNNSTNHKAQTLITLLIFMLIAISIASTSVSIIISNAQVTSASAQSMEAYYAAEAGVENASIRLLRNIDYPGETIQLSSTSSVTITVTHNGNYEVVSTGKNGDYTRIIQANLDYTNNILQVVSWKELF